MTNERFEKRVRALEQQALKHPALYKARVVALALFGNLYLAVVLLFLLALLLALCAAALKLKALAIKLAFALGVFLWLVVKSLWVKLSPPEGLALTPEQAPRLFALIDELRRSLRAPRFHHVLITSDFNAGVIQLPRLGLFGWPRNYLQLGLPLMKALSVDQFKSVLAHEFGHLAKGHGKSAGWIYCQRQRWSQLATTLEHAKSMGSLLFNPFLSWFAPVFCAYSFPMARSEEYEADATAARLTSPRTTAEALAMLRVIGTFLAEVFWPNIYLQAESQSAPARLPFASLTPALAGGVPAEAAEAWLSRALQESTGLTNTHPALCDRLRALKAEAGVTWPAADAAADTLLDGLRERLAAELDQAWWADKKADWEAHHRQVQEDRLRLADLDGRAARDESLSVEEACERARLTDRISRRTEEALAQLRALYGRHPERAIVCFDLGVRLLSRDESEGLGLLERAMSLDEEATAACCELIRDYHWRVGRKEEAHAWHKRLIERQQTLATRDKERNEVALKDTFEPHGLPEETVSRLRQQLGAVANLRRAYLAKKRVAHRPEQPCYVFGFHITPPFQLFTLLRVEKAVQQIQESVTFPGETIIISVEGENVRFERKLKRVRGARLV